MDSKPKDAWRSVQRETSSPFWMAFLISHDVILIHEPMGRIVEANPAATGELGYSIDELRELSIGDLVLVSEDVMRERVRRTGAEGETVFEARHRRKDGTTFDTEVRTRPVEVDGQELIVGIGRDITDRRLAEMLNSTLDQMSSAFNSRMDFDQIMRSVVSSARLALESDSAIIALRETGQWSLCYEDGSTDHVDLRALAGDDSVAGRLVMGTGKMVLVNDVQGDPRLNQQHADLYNVRSMMVAPLRIKGSTAGVLGFFNHSREGAFSDAHVDFANKLAYSISLLVENARLRESERTVEEFLRGVVETVPDAIVVIDPDGWFTFANREAERLLGIPRDAILRSHIDDPRWDISTLDGKPIAADSSPFALAKHSTGSIHGLEYKYQAGDREVFFSINITPLVGEEGEFRGAIASLTDVTDQRKARERLVREKEQMSALMETTPSGIVLLDREERILFANRSAMSILGIGREEMKGQKYGGGERWPVTDYEGRPLSPEERPFSIVTATGRPVFGLRMTVQRPDGRKVMLLTNAAPLFDSTGTMSGVIVSLEDLTASILTERALRISLRTSDDIIQQIPSGILLFQHRPPDRLVLLSVNPTANILLGGLENKLGKDFDDIWKEGAFFATKEDFMEVVRTGQTIWREGVHYSDLTVDGNFTFRAFCLPDERLCVNFDDVTERMREARLRREAFEQIELNIVHFATLVDRIRNPLSAILAHTDSCGAVGPRIVERASEIEAILSQLDQGWLESEKVRGFLKKTL